MSTEPRRVVLASTNRHKAVEIGRILGPLGVQVEAAESLPHVEETGTTFAENALLKARSAALALGRYALADDSGLAVDVLGGDPGVRSARYAGGEGDAEANNALLIERLGALGARDPAARFVCHAVVVAPDGRIVAEAEGRVEGVIRWPARGECGFGYDPLFHHPPSDKRFSELTAEEKNAVSHRGRALRALVAAWPEAEG